MQRVCVFLLITTPCIGNTFSGEPESLADRITRITTEVRNLDALYKESDDPTERSLALRHIIRKSIWLEQIGGSGEARSDRIMALARLAVLGKDPSLRYGYLGEPSGAVTAELVLRRPAATDLPRQMLDLGKQRLFFLSLRNLSNQPMTVSQGTYAERRNLVGEIRQIPMMVEEKLPGAVRGRAALFSWPKQIAPGEDIQRMVLFPDAGGTLIAIAVPVRVGGSTEKPQRTVRVVFPEALYPDAYRQAVRVAAKESIRLRQAREEARKVAEAAKPAQDPKEKKPKPRTKPKPPTEKPQPADNFMPPILGTVDKSRADNTVRIRLRLGARAKPLEIFRIRKNGRWRGRIRMQKTLVGMADSGEKHIYYWATVFEGNRNDMVDGTVHRDHELRRR